MHVFISHSRQNASAALKLCERLIARGVEPWLDMRELDSGADWVPRVTDAIHQAAAFVFLIGPDPSPEPSQRFEWQQITEGEYYLDPDKPLIPIVIGTVELPGFLRARQAVEVNPASIDFDALAARVADALSRPAETVDHEKLARGRLARQRALDNLKEYSLDLEKEDVKRAGLRGLK